MEDTQREQSPAAHRAVRRSPSPEAFVDGSRKRAAGSKRKISVACSGGSSLSASAKRVFREKLNTSLPPLPTGPCTRARQSPVKFSVPSTSEFELAAVQQKVANQLMHTPASDSGDQITDASKSIIPREIPKFTDSAIVTQFQAIKTLEPNSHVVPTPAGWFSWTKIHPLEERMMPSFFNGMSEARTSKIYMEIRNAIVRAFHENPQKKLELKDLSELSVGSSEAAQEVMEFLDHWGLINFHPFPLSPSNATPRIDIPNKVSDLMKRLYHFELIEVCPPVSSEEAILVSEKRSRLLPETAIVDDMARPEGPSVEYHCNSCTADCSRKRYHCQTQADYDLCMECFKEGKFGSGMSTADFILMEPANALGITSGSWTDQETLLLLEALELYGENWNEIAEHVATKTKARCMLHFMQMPIEDSFLDDNYGVDAGLQGNLVPEEKTSVFGVTPEMKKDVPSGNEEPSLPSLADGCKSNAYTETEDCSETSASDIAHDALKSAFDATGAIYSSGAFPSFKESANPAMTLAAFLASLVDDVMAAASAHDSLKASFEDSPSVQLAARHCFLLDDSPVKGRLPPSDKTDSPPSDKNLSACGSVGTDTVNMEAQKEMSSVPNGRTDESSSNLESQKCSINPKTLERDVEQDFFESGEQLVCSTSNVSEKQPDDLAVVVNIPPAIGKESANLTTLLECTSATTAVQEVGSSPKHATYTSNSVTHFQVVPESGEMISGPVLDEGKEPQHNVGSDFARDTSMLQAARNEAETSKKGTENVNEKTCSCTGSSMDDDLYRLKSAARTALSAASVKAKLLADKEEDIIRELVSLLIEKQLHKLEIKVSFFSDMEVLMLWVRGQLEIARQKLYHERAQIIASRLRLPASLSRPATLPQPPNKVAQVYSRPPDVTGQQPSIKETPLLSSTS